MSASESRNVNAAMPPEPEDGLSPEYREAVASVRLEALEPTPYALDLFRRASAGELTMEQVRTRLIAYHRSRARRTSARAR